MRENMAGNDTTGDQNIDDKISKLQSLLAMAKGGKWKKNEKMNKSLIINI